MKFYSSIYLRRREGWCSRWMYLKALHFLSANTFFSGSLSAHHRASNRAKMKRKAVPAKRVLSESSGAEGSSTDKNDRLFDLDDEESARFWRREDSLRIAETAIENKIQSLDGLAYATPVVLEVMKRYMIELYSSGIKPVSASKSAILIEFLSGLETYHSLEKEINDSVKQYLACSITCSGNFPTILRSSLTKCLAARALVPTIGVIELIKGGQSLLTDWLKKINDLSKSASKAVIDILVDLLSSPPRIGRPIVETAILSLLEFSTASRVLAAVAVWKELWVNVGTKPAAVGKKQALALLEFAITTRPDLLGIESQTTDNGCTIFKFKRILNSIMSVNFETSKATLMKSDINSAPIAFINCPELFPLIIVCHAEKDRSITSAALQLLANNAHSSVIRWSTIFHPSAIWTAVIGAAVVCLEPVEPNKAAQHKILSVLSQILLSNPFGRNFHGQCTAKQATTILKEELKEMILVKQNLARAEPKGNDKIIKLKLEADRAVEFLIQEASFVKTFQDHCYSSVLKVLAQGRLGGLATRTVAVIESILNATCCGADPCILMEYLGGLPQELNEMIVKVIGNRCMHEESFIELASYALESIREDSTYDSGHNILTTAGYLQLHHLSSLLTPCETYAPGSTSSTDEAQSLKIVVSLLTKLTALFSDYENTGIFTSCESSRQIERILLCLSVLPLEWKSNNFVKDQIQCHSQRFLASLDALKDKMMKGSKDAALHCSLWLLYISQAITKTDHKNSRTIISRHSMEKLTSIIYPDLLANKWVMPAAIALAMQLNDPQQLLFESIGFLQDMTFGSSETDIDMIDHYSNLIATVIVENSKMVRKLARLRVFSADLTQVIASTLITCKKGMPDSLFDYASNESKCNGPLVKEEPFGDGYFTDMDYMKAANLEEQAVVAEREDLERSVDSNSFLACFVPLFTKLVMADELPEVVRVGALRTLAAYMKCSRSILQEHQAIFEAFIECCPRRDYGLIDCNNIYYLHQLRAEAVLVWTENFTAASLSLKTPVVGLLDCLCNDALLKNHESDTDATSEILVSAGPKSRLPHDSQREGNSDKGWCDFATLIMQCMHCLLKENKVRDSAECVVAIGIPLAFDNKKLNRIGKIIQEESSTILRDVFLQTPKLLSRSLYKLCIPSQQIEYDGSLVKEETASCATSVAPHTSLNNLMETVIDKSQRLRLVAAFIQIAQCQESLKSKLAEVDRALTDEVIRCNSSFALAALEYLDVTAESVTVIKEAMELGILNTLDRTTANKLNNRVANLMHSGEIQK